MFCAYTRPRYQVSVYRIIGPLVIKLEFESIKVTYLDEMREKHNSNSTKFKYFIHVYKTEIHYGLYNIVSRVLKQY